MTDHAPESVDQTARFTAGAYLRDRATGVVAWLAGMVGVSCMLPILGVNAWATAFVCLFLGLCGAAGGSVDFLRRRQAFEKLEGLLSGIESGQRNALGETELTALEARIAYDACCAVGRKAGDEAAELRKELAGRQRYMDLWAHEIKAPIAAISLVAAQSHDERGATVAREAERIESYVEQALYSAKASSLEQDYAIREMDLGRTVREACMKHMRFLIEHGTTPVFEVAEGTTVLADKPWISFILGQLATNSAKYGARTITFSSFELEAGTPRGRTVLEVKDDGCGIPAADMPRVFERGFTGSNGRESGTATGMGLHLTATLCEAMGLGVGLASEEGTGTRVMITFPHDRRALDVRQA